LARDDLLARLHERTELVDDDPDADPDLDVAVDAAMRAAALLAELEAESLTQPATPA
jgi:hypothetical protein